MFVDATLNRKAFKSVMINTSATYNFVYKVEAHRLVLKFDKDEGNQL